MSVTPWDRPRQPRAASGPTKRRLAKSRLDRVTPREVEYLWDRRIACGKLGLIAGDGGIGKSTLMADVTARVTRGADWPDGRTADPGDVVYLTAEDGAEDTIVPRLLAADADLARVHLVHGVLAGNASGALEWFTLEPRNLALLEELLLDTGASLLFIDPMASFYGAIDSHVDSEIRQVLAPLAGMAERTGVAVIGNVHLGKATDRKAQHRILGSVGIVNLARLVLGVTWADPAKTTATDRRVLVPVKTNICAPAPPLAFTISAPRPDQPNTRIVWETGTLAGLNADALFNTHPPSAEDRTAREDAGYFLRELLQDGPKRSADIFKLGKADGHSVPTLRRASHDLDVGVRPLQDKHGQFIGWEWWMPPLGTGRP